MKLVAPSDLFLPALGDHVAKGDVVEVDDATGDSLETQGWKRAGNRKPAHSSLHDIAPDEPDSADPSADPEET